MLLEKRFQWFCFECEIHVKCYCPNILFFTFWAVSKNIINCWYYLTDTYQHCLWFIEKCIQIAITGKVYLHLKYPFTPHLIPTHQFKVYHPVIFVCFMSSSSCTHAGPNLNTCADNIISCQNLVFLHPAFRHYVSDLWCDQSLTRLEVSVMIFIFIIVAVGLDLVFFLCTYSKTNS